MEDVRQFEIEIQRDWVLITYDIPAKMDATRKRVIRALRNMGALKHTDSHVCMHADGSHVNEDDDVCSRWGSKRKKKSWRKERKKNDYFDERSSKRSFTKIPMVNRFKSALFRFLIYQLRYVLPEAVSLMSTGHRGSGLSRPTSGRPIESTPTGSTRRTQSGLGGWGLSMSLRGRGLHQKHIQTISS